MIIVGIDASNILAGGGVTHLVELLGTAKPQEHSDRLLYFYRVCCLSSGRKPEDIGEIAEYVEVSYNRQKRQKRLGCFE